MSTRALFRRDVIWVVIPVGFVILSSAAFGEALRTTRVVSARSGRAEEAVADEIVIRLAPNIGPAQVRALHQAGGGTLVQSFGRTGIQRIHIPPGTSILQMVERYRQQPGVLDASPNWTYRHCRIPNDPRYREQTYLTQIEALAAWDVRTDASQVIVAVVDSGIDLDHPDLVANLWVNQAEIPGNGLDDDGNGFIDDVHGWDFISNNNDPSPTPNGVDENFDGEADESVSHGTEAAGLIGAVGNNGVGIAGPAWRVKLMPLQVFPDDGPASLSAVVAGIEYAIANGAKIINLSLGGSYTTFFDSTIRRAANAGVLLVAAAGNELVDLDTTPESPVCNDLGMNAVLGVAAVTHEDRRAWYSNWGAGAVDVSAPGDNLLTTTYQGGAPFLEPYGTATGTSFAAPIVAGMAALILAQDSTLGGSELTDRIRQAVDSIDSVNPSYAGELGTGRINMRLALTGPELERPSRPTNPSPEDWSVDAAQQVTLRWSPSADPQQQTVRYDVYFGSGGQLPRVSTGQTTTSYGVSGLESGISYWWQVVARDPDGNEAASPAWTFGVGQADIYEEDDTYSVAKPIRTDGSRQHHEIGSLGDRDWVKFRALANETYIIETFVSGVAGAGRTLQAGAPLEMPKLLQTAGAADTVLTLYATDGRTLIDTNDDTNGIASRITWTATVAGTYYVEVKFFEDLGTGRYQISVTASGGAQPSTTPSHIALELSDTEVLLGQSILATATVTDSAGGPVRNQRVLFTARRQGQSEVLASTSVVTGENGQATGTIETAGASLGTLAITAQVESMAALTATTTATLVYRLEIPKPAGPRGIRILTSPVPGDLAPLLGVPASQVVAARYSVANGYEFYSGANWQATLGRAFWIRLTQDAELSASSGSPANASASYEVPLDEGWTLLGNPFVRALTWDPDQIRVKRSGADVGTLARAAAQGLVEPYGWTWNGATDQYMLVYDASIAPRLLGELGVGDGAWVRANTSGISLVLPGPLTATQAEQATLPLAERSGQLEPGVFCITAQAAGVAPVEVVVGSPQGQHRLASEWGIALPPEPIGAGDHSLGLAALRRGARLYADLRPQLGPSAEFELELAVRGIQEPVRLTWPDLRSLPREYDVRLVDQQTGRTIAMRTSPSYEVQFAPGESHARRLSVIVQRRGRGALRLLVDPPQSVTRQGAFSVLVRLELSRDAEVWGVVRNAAGRVVRRLPARDMPAGRSQIVWDGRSDTGAQLPAGLYVLELSAASADGERTTAVRTVMR